MSRWLAAAGLKPHPPSDPVPKPTEPTKPSPDPVLSVSSVLSKGVEAPKPTAADDAFDRNEERAAIREFDGAQPREAAEAAALAEAAQAAGTTPEALRRNWATHPDAIELFTFLTAHGPHSYGAAAPALGWGATRAWAAEARLRAAGVIVHDGLGQAVVKQGAGLSPAESKSAREW